ncbi:MAG: hypothetical protein JWQ90_4952 [Hydrocarboniphaga sp.]|uniref:tetratricopeptide repeat protein n=1 Tax=Hydrocarboniphaga sp. TaxID=2033016 RepID=UPI0026128937|nr:tetratricopeptide repeat protein [Hydrocarboniphaga sp.]MDB5972502.1 hypothetical protein [Hydrocarboniphaga sp.]
MNIFEGKDLRVVGRLFDRSLDQLVITFTGRAAAPPVAKGFGENYLIKRQISAVHFISKDNHWWQTAELRQAIDEVERLGLIQNRGLTLYGSSMGAYAALMVSGRLKPKRLILFSPQFSIDGKRVPFEKRWRNYAAKLSFDYDDMAACVDHDAEIKAVFDPHYEPDTRHIDLIEQLRPLERIAIPFAGHNTARALEELGILTQVTDALLSGNFDKNRFSRQYRSLRAGSSLFWHGFSEALEQRRHAAASTYTAMLAALVMSNSGRMNDPVLRRDILRRGMAAACELELPIFARNWLSVLEPLEKHPYQVSYFRALLARAENNWPLALSEATAASNGSPDSPVFLALKLEAATKCGEAAGVLLYCDQHTTRVRRSGALLLAQAMASAGMQQWQATLDTLKLVFRYDRRNPRARALAVHCWIALGRPEAAEKQLAPVLQFDLPSPQLAAEIRTLLANGGSRGPAKRYEQRQTRNRERFNALVTELGGLDWKIWPAQIPDLRARHPVSRRSAPSALS